VDITAIEALVASKFTGFALALVAVCWLWRETARLTAKCDTLQVAFDAYRDRIAQERLDAVLRVTAALQAQADANEAMARLQERRHA
jgi:hypothetical protein